MEMIIILLDKKITKGWIEGKYKRFRRFKQGLRWYLWRR
jgi:hypothetical protein